MRLRSVTCSINDYAVDSVLSGVQYPHDREEYLLLKDQQQRKQDKSDKECPVGNVQM